MTSTVESMDTTKVNDNSEESCNTRNCEGENAEASSSATSEAEGVAESLKEAANDMFKRADYQEAVEFYSKAINVLPKAVYYANRSISYLRLELFGSALDDANDAIKLDKNYLKGYYRRAAALMALGKFKQALKDFETIVKVSPKNEDAKKKLNECSKIVKRMAFERAIAVDDSAKKSAADTVNLEAIIVESTYDGPVLGDNEPITAEFMTCLLSSLKEGNKLHKKFAYRIILEAKKIFEACESLIDIDVPNDHKFTVCGDIHGQFFDLLNIFTLNGWPSELNPYLFNGDFVDRGSFSVEVILTLFGFKVLYPNHFFMARGNHESMTMNQMYGFEGEVKAKYSSHMYDLFAEVFNLLPLAHCINKRILVMHGGLFSDDDVTLDMIRKIDRNRQPPDEGLMCELLWSDPMNAPGRAPSKRGVGLQFGPDVTDKFCKLNNLDMIIRSHEVKADGYESAHDGKCITVFSAPNYCDAMGNKGAYIVLHGGELKPFFATYREVPHPDVKPMAYANSFYGLI